MFVPVSPRLQLKMPEILFGNSVQKKRNIFNQKDETEQKDDDSV